MLITIPIPQKISTNAIYAGSHWSKRNRQKNLYRESTIEFKNLKPIKKKDYPVDISYIFRFKGKPLDSSNVSYMTKLLEDSLIHHGVLDDDDPAHVASTQLISMKGEKDEVTIYIS